MPEQLDQQLFLFLNSANSPFWDKVMSFLSMIAVWIPLYLAILIFLGKTYKKKFPIILFFIIIDVVLTDQSALLIKNTVERYRPCHEPSLKGLVHTVDGWCGGMYGFVSSHAANSFNVALLSLMFIKKKSYSVSIIVWAASISYSRIYLGVHYPGDVFCGALLGALIGWGMYRLYELIDKKTLHYKNPPTPPGGADSQPGIDPPFRGAGG
jgi:undecaprenyl-diphosphatase